MKPGTQVVYIPRYADGKLFHPDMEYGFVTKDCGDDNHFVRYWYKDTDELRTKSCSEKTPNDCLHEMDSRKRKLVQKTMEKIFQENVGEAIG
jgi:hypothetical protein